MITPDIIKAYMTTKAGNATGMRGQSPRDSPEKAVPGQRTERSVGLADAAWPTELDNRCPAAARSGYWDEQDCRWPVVKLYVRS